MDGRVFSRRYFDLPASGPCRVWIEYEMTASAACVCALNSGGEREAQGEQDGILVKDREQQAVLCGGGDRSL
ncbi:hypothetical protein BaRGS_00018134 [Batillaria attramentaria]|uniref:Uncharacterized protein n=1 Tax=Batillaria attramentaria TaxID=370345 RepID=A0ABD0KUE4_9CAEN